MVVFKSNFSLFIYILSYASPWRVHNFNAQQEKKANEKPLDSHHAIK